MNEIAKSIERMNETLKETNRKLEWLLKSKEIKRDAVMDPDDKDCRVEK